MAVVPSTTPVRRAESASSAAARLYADRLEVALKWRRDHQRHPDRDQLWRSYRTGALWTVRDRHERLRRSMQAALDAAADDVPFAAAP